MFLITLKVCLCKSLQLVLWNLIIFVLENMFHTPKSVSKLTRILEEVARANCLLEGPIDIVVLPFLRTCFAIGLKAHLLSLQLYFLLCKRVCGETAQVFLRSNQYYRSVLTNLPNFSSPLINILKWGSVVNGNTEHEAVCPVVAHLAIDAKVLVTARIMDFKL